MTPAVVWARRAIWGPWALLAAAVLAALLISARLNSLRRAADEGRRLAEAETLRQRGLIVVEQRARGELEARARELEAADVDLRAELERVRSAAPSVRVVEVVRASTGPVPAGGEPREATVQMGPVAREPVPEGAPCLLAVGDQGEVRVDEVELRTDAGNGILVGAASAWRVSPGPETRLFGGPFRAPLTSVAAAPEPARPGWGVGPRAGVGRDGWTAGLAVSPPQWSLWGWSVELVAGAGLGSGGAWDTGAMVVIRQ